MTYKELDNKLQGRCKNKRKLAHNTWAERTWDWEGDAIAIRYHATQILHFYPNGDIKLNVGRWFTVTTQRRLNKYLRDAGFYIGSHKGVWMLWRNGTVAVFTNNMFIHTCRGTVSGTISYREWQLERQEAMRVARKQKAHDPLRCWELVEGHYCNLFLKGQVCARHGLLALPGHEEAV